MSPALQVRLVFLFAVICGALPATAMAEETSDDDVLEVIVTANPVPTERRKVGSSVTVITREEIDSSQKTNVSEILRDVPGLDVIRSGGPGGNTSVFLRGANSEHTLVLVDGIEANNPGSNARFFNFADLTLDDVERIEIVRGPQSTVYGSDAIGGVISITTRKGDGAPGGYASAEGGSYDTFIGKGGVNGGDEILNWSYAFSRQDARPTSAAGTKYGNFEKDPYDNTAHALRFGVSPFEEGQLDIFFRHTDSNTDIDNFGGVGGDDPNRELDNTTTLFRTQASFDFFEGMYVQRISGAITDHKLLDNNDEDDDHPGETLRSQYDGTLLKFDTQSELNLSDEVQVVLGAETEEEKASNSLDSDGPFGPFSEQLPEQTSRTNGFYAHSLVSPLEWFSSSFGVRYDDNIDVGDETTFRVVPAVYLEESGTKLRGSVGSGFKAPSLFQRFSSFGNKELQAEESLGWDIGVDQAFLDDRVEFGVTYFENEIDDLVTFEPGTLAFDNIDEAEIYGFEVSVTVRPVEFLEVAADYTYTDTEDQETSRSLLRRPRNKGSLRSTLFLMERKAEVGVNFRYVGERADNNFSSFPAERITLGSYTLVDLRGAYNITDELKLFTRVENLFDEDYEEVYGFGTPGLAAYGGIEVTVDDLLTALNIWT